LRGPYEQVCQKWQIEPSHHAIFVSLGQQILWLLRDGEAQAAYPLSFSRKPISCRENSQGTPWGLHAVAEKHGEGAAPGTVFVGRVPQGRYWELADAGPEQPAYVATRILWLKGLEPDLNQGGDHDTYGRYVYIHGTVHPERFPQRDSSGCLLLRDDDLIALFDQTPVDTHVYIDRDGLEA